MNVAVLFNPISNFRLHFETAHSAFPLDKDSERRERLRGGGFPQRVTWKSLFTLFLRSGAGHPAKLIVKS
jgi:hypothetical protein